MPTRSTQHTARSTQCVAHAARQARRHLLGRKALARYAFGHVTLPYPFASLLCSVDSAAVLANAHHVHAPESALNPDAIPAPR